MTTPLKSLTSETKDSKFDLQNNSWERDAAINKFLKSVPHLEFSANGIENIANRFLVPIDHLNQLIYKARKAKLR